MGISPKLLNLVAEENKNLGQDKIELTEDQQKAVDFIDSVKDGIVVIDGSAGTGKTTSVKGLVSNKATALTAPTHQAATVLREKTGRDTRTIQSLLNIRPDPKKRDQGVQDFVQDPNKTLDYYPTVIVDEGSMLGRSITGYIDEYYELMKRKHRTSKVIIIGDEKQLPPVGEEFSPIFRKEYPRFTLSKILRQAAANDNIDLSLNLHKLETYQDGEYYKWLEDINYDLLVEANGSKRAKFLCWTNSRVKAVNDKVRRHIYGENAYEFEVGEVLLVKESLTYHTNEEVPIKTVVPDHIFAGGKRIDYYTINNDLNVVAERSKKDFDNYLKQIAIACSQRRERWQNFWQFKEAFDTVQYNHAMTVHRSQGSTFDDCIIDISEILGNSNKVEREKMLYTAITRTANFNYLV